MSEFDEQNGHAGEPEPARVETRSPWRVSLVWLVPLIALLVGGSLALKAYLDQGPEIRITFSNANGLTAGETEVKYKNVVIGKVADISLSKDALHVIATVDLDSKAASFASKGARFWVVRPRVGLGGVSGLGTLISGAYIGADIGYSRKAKYKFKGLESPPAVTHGSRGTTVRLHAENLGSLNIGSPVYFHNIKVGRIVDFSLDKDGDGVTLKTFIKAPNDRFVTRNARFWNASGLHISIGSGGLKVNTQSLTTVLAGGIAFQPMPDAPKPNGPIAKGAAFRLFASKDDALAPPSGPGQKIRMRFTQSLRGLSPGAEVAFRGISFGKVTAVDLAYNPKTHQFPVDVTAMVYPRRLGKVNARIKQYRRGSAGDFLEPMVKRGFRAQAVTANLITGQRYISLDFVPHAKPVKFNPNSKPLRIPTVSGNFTELQREVSDILAKVNQLPLKKLGAHMNETVKNAALLLKHVDEGLLPRTKADLKAARRTLDAAHDSLARHSPLQQNLQQTLHELGRAARALRTLSNYLGQHPGALLRGKPADASPRYHNGQGGSRR